MLSEILSELRKSNGFINMNELGRRMELERSTLDGMLDTLVGQGKIKEVCDNGTACSSCAGCGSKCLNASGGIKGAKTFIIINR